MEQYQGSRLGDRVLSNLFLLLLSGVVCELPVILKDHGSTVRDDLPERLGIANHFLCLVAGRVIGWIRWLVGLGRLTNSLLLADLLS